MSMQKLRLVGCDRFNFKGELYERSKVYAVGESKAAIMLRKKDEYGRAYFVAYVKPAKTKAQRVAEAAVAAAVAAAEAAVAEEEAIVVRPDGSEPVDDLVVVDDPDAAVVVEVDKDDDEDLDGDDPVNTEEVVVEEEVEVGAEDRDDGTAVEV